MRISDWSSDVCSSDLTGETEKLTAYLSVMSSPQLSPDGRYIAFNAMKRSEFWYGDMSDAYVVELPSRVVRRFDMKICRASCMASVFLFLYFSLFAFSFLIYIFFFFFFLFFFFS